MNSDRLTAAGVDYAEGVERFGGKPELFERYLERFFASPLMDAFERQMDAREYAAAFRTAHDLKAASGNLSIGGYYRKMCELTEFLRGGQPAVDCGPLLLQARALYETARQAATEEKA